MKISIEIEEIENGFIIKFFASFPSPERFDKHIFVKTWDEVIAEIVKWRKDIIVEVVEK
jgi:hypothetical protein